MADGFQQVNADGTGKHIDCEELTASFIKNGNTHSNAIIDNIASTAELDAGMSVSGSGIPGGATILTVDSTSQVTMTANASTSLTATPVTFSHQVFRQRTVIAGALQAAVAAVKNAVLDGTEYALATRPIVDDIVDTFSLTPNTNKTIALLGRSVVYVVLTTKGDINPACAVSGDGGTTFASIYGFKLPSGAPVSSLSATGTYRFVVAGASHFKISSSLGTAGSQIGSLRASSAVSGDILAQLMVGTDAIGGDATNGLDVDPTRVVPDLSSTFSGNNTNFDTTLSGQSVAIVRVDAVGTGDPLVEFKVSNDGGTTYDNVLGYPIGGGSPALNTAVIGAWRIPVSGSSKLRVTTSKSTGSGTISGTIRASVADLIGPVSKTLDLDTTSGVDNVPAVAIALPGSGGSVVGGTLTNPLRNDPVPATTGAPAGVVVSTSAVQLKALNTARKGIEVSNTGVSNLYIGTSSSVTSAAGANQGQVLMPGFSWMPPCPYTGAVYAISDQTSAVENASVLELT